MPEPENTVVETEAREDPLVEDVLVEEVRQSRGESHHNTICR